jgi:hypothetical protein
MIGGNQSSNTDHGNVGKSNDNLLGSLEVEFPGIQVKVLDPFDMHHLSSHGGHLHDPRILSWRAKELLLEVNAACQERLPEQATHSDQARALPRIIFVGHDIGGVIIKQVCLTVHTAH